MIIKGGFFMNRRISIVAILIVFSIIVAPGFPGLLHVASAQSDVNPADSTGPSAPNLSGPVRAIVELEGESVAARARRFTPATIRRGKIDFESASARAVESEIEVEQNTFASKAALVSPSLHVEARHRKLINAVTIEAQSTELAAIAALPDVKSVEMEKQYHATLDSSVPLIGTPALWEKLGGSAVAGEGIKIAILDTGIDQNNPLFSGAGFVAPEGFPRGDAGFTNNKVIVAKSFLNGSSSPLDENGHGTNVAGIAAGNLNTITPLGPISGVAPRAFLGNYRVLNRSGSGGSSGIISALTEAVTDGFDVANLSLGSDAGKTLDALARAVETAVASGMTVCIAAGNEGAQGEKTIGSPGIAPSAITVGATFLVEPSLAVTDPAPVSPSVANLVTARGTGGISTSLLLASIGPLGYADTSSLNGQSRVCGALPDGSLTGKVALIERGDCTFTDKVNAAQAAGAVAAIIFNQPSSEKTDGSGGDQLLEMSVPGTAIPSVFVSRTSGLALRDWLNSHPTAKLKIDPFGSDVVAAFSSRGPSSLETLKPDLTAPGFNIYSGAITTSNSDGVSDPSGFLAVSGTSQATPHVAGAAALIKQLHPSWQPQQIKSALMSSAGNTTFNDLTELQPAGVLDAGAGPINLARAAGVSAAFSPASLSFGINKLKKKAVTLSSDFNITNMSGGSESYKISIQQIDPGDGVEITSSEEMVSLSPGQSSTVTITIAAAKTAVKRDYTGYILITDSLDQTYRVPYWVRYVKKKK